jgi:hypothetical protein
MNFDSLNFWREKNRNTIQSNFKVFQELTLEAKKLEQSGYYIGAAAYVEIAAEYARSNHCGFYASTEIEEILLRIGQKSMPEKKFKSKGRSQSEHIKNVLHVSTNVAIYSGIPRLIRRWIQQDNQRSHSLALTKQAPDEVPKLLREAVLNSQGKIFILNAGNANSIVRARRLKKYASKADVIVLHTWEKDIVPTIAFADKRDSPPIIYTNHGDHWFWLGNSISDIVANLRESGMRLSQKRRGIEAERNLLLPTILEPVQRHFSRSEAKIKLGIDEKSILLLSIARSPKYKSIDDTNFADAHVALLDKYKKAVLVIIGAGNNNEDWSTAIEKTQGRIRVLEQTEDTAIFYQAADIYVDSFPFVSITSLLEAGSYAVPLVSRYPYPSEACEIFGADMPGLDGNIIWARKFEEYISILSNLIEDKNFRLSLGESTRQKIVEIHLGHSWQKRLEDLYARANTLPTTHRISHAIDEVFLEEPDIFLPMINNVDFNLDWLYRESMGAMPLFKRWHLWRELSHRNGSRLEFSSMLSDGLKFRYSQLKLIFKNFYFK